MSKIDIHICLDDGDTLENALRKLGLGVTRAVSSKAIDAALNAPHGETDREMSDEEAEIHANVAADIESASVAQAAAPAPGLVPAADRPIGQPGPGRKRRTAAEVEEDRLRLAARPQMSADDVAAVQGTLVTNTSSISTGEARVNPEDAAQDEADEAAESAAAKTKLTRDDIRRAVKRYSDAFGIPAAVSDITGIIGSGLMDVPETQETIAEAIAKIDAAIAAGKPETKQPEPAKVEAPPVGTQGDVIAAILAYGKKYDGTADQAKLVLTKEDLPKLFSKVFGGGVTGLGSMPQTPEAFGKIITAINEATRDNPFGRVAK